MRRATRLPLLCVAGLAVACATERQTLDRGSLDGSVYTNHALGLRVEAPDGWTLEADHRSVPARTRVLQAYFGGTIDPDRFAAKHELFTMSARTSEPGGRADLSLSASASLVPYGSKFRVENFADAIERIARNTGRAGGRADVGLRRWTEIAGRRFLVVPMTLERAAPWAHIDLYFCQEDRVLLSLGIVYAPGEEAVADAALRAITRISQASESEE